MRVVEESFGVRVILESREDAEILGKRLKSSRYWDYNRVIKKWMRSPDELCLPFPAVDVHLEKEENYLEEPEFLTLANQY